MERVPLKGNDNLVRGCLSIIKQASDKKKVGELKVLPHSIVD